MTIHKWNTDKPHRCPTCHSVAVRGKRAPWWRIIVCPECGTRFAAWGWKR